MTEFRSRTVKTWLMGIPGNPLRVGCLEAAHATKICARAIAKTPDMQPIAL